MARPTTPSLWASESTAISNEPALGYKQTGFPVSQPPVDYMNWALQNIYQWIDYFDGAGVGGGGGLTITFDSSRPRIQLPFALPADNQLAAIEVFKRETAAVGGISSSVHSASGAVEAGSVTPASYTYGTDAYTSPLARASNIRPVSAGVIGSIGNPGTARSDFGRFVRTSGNAIYMGGSRSRPILRGSSNIVFLDHASNLMTSSLSWTSGNFFLEGMSQTAGTNLFNEIKSKIYLIMAASQSDIAAGRFVAWNLSRYTEGLDSSGRVQPGGVASNPPIYSNASFASLNYWVFASSYARVAGERTGSARSSALPALSGSPGYGVASYAYDPAANTVTLIMSGAVSATSFHTFKIKSGTQDRLSLLASNAVFTASAKRFVWSNIAADPIPSAGTYTFEFFESGSGLPVYRFTALTSGLSIEEYEGNYYLYVSSGVANGDVLFIRRRQAA